MRVKQSENKSMACAFDEFYEGVENKGMCVRPYIIPTVQYTHTVISLYQNREEKSIVAQNLCMS